MNWDFSFIKNKSQQIVNEFKLENYISFEPSIIAKKIYEILLKNDIALPQPQIEKDQEGTINVSWFRLKTEKGLSFTIDGDHLNRFIKMNYLSGQKAIDVKSPTNDQILETIKDFLKE